MSGEKKFYSAKEAAIAVLQKAEEMLKSSKHKHIGWDKLESKLEGEGYSKKTADKINGSIKAKMEKGEAPPGEIHPKEPQAGESEQPGARIKHQEAPQNNPHEQAEGNNPEWGTSPDVKGHLKLAHFMGHMSAKKKHKASAGNPNEAAPAQAAVDPKMKKGIALS